jgi:hypothetical protein
MKKDIEALDAARDILLENFTSIKSNKDLKVCNALIANANALSNDITTKIKLLKAEETTIKTISRLGGE